MIKLIASDMDGTLLNDKNEIHEEFYKVFQELKKKNIIFSDNPTFYISKDGIVICFSSYELDPSISDLSTFKISFEEDRSYLSNYIIEKIIDI